jgi:hypothetical protein
MFLSLISFPAFFISLVVGLLLVYIFNPTPTVIYVYPTPDNIDKLQYKDNANNCYEFQPKEVKCPADKSLISIIPLQSKQ